MMITAEDIKARVNPLQVIGRYTELVKRGGDWKGLCPFHQEKTPSFGVKAETGEWHCFGCGAGGDIITFIMKAENLIFPEAIDFLAKHECVMDLSPVPAAARRQPEPTPDDGTWHKSLDGLQPYQDSPAETYLRGRGLLRPFPLICGAKYHPAWSVKGSQPYPAVVFPMYDQAGNLVAADGRYINGFSDPKTRTAGTKSKGAFMTPGAFDGDIVIIVESAINALTLAQAGFPTMATCGAENHAPWLPAACRGKRVVIGFDPDAGGENGARNLYYKLKKEGGKILGLPIPFPGKDWNDLLQEYGRDELAAALRRVLYPVEPAFHPGDRITDLWHTWRGTVTTYHAPESLFPSGWLEFVTDGGQVGQFDCSCILADEREVAA